MLQVVYPGRKIIVWMANTHILSNPTQIVPHYSDAGAYTSVGQYAKVFDSWCKL